MHTPRPDALLEFQDLPAPDKEKTQKPRQVIVFRSDIQRIVMNIQGVAHIHTIYEGPYRVNVDKVREITQEWINWLRYAAGKAKEVGAASIPSPVYQFISPTPSGQEDKTVAASLQHIGSIVEKPLKGKETAWMVTFSDGYGLLIKPEKVKELRKQWELWLKFMAS
jgi:hypothetical protein